MTPHNMTSSRWEGNDDDDGGDDHDVVVDDYSYDRDGYDDIGHVVAVVLSPGDQRGAGDGANRLDR
jgi:hypothetical protein